MFRHRSDPRNIVARRDWTTCMYRLAQPAQCCFDPRRKVALAVAQSRNPAIAMPLTFDALPRTGRQFPPAAACPERIILVQALLRAVHALHRVPGLDVVAARRRSRTRRRYRWDSVPALRNLCSDDFAACPRMIGNHFGRCIAEIDHADIQQAIVAETL